MKSSEFTATPSTPVRREISVDTEHFSVRFLVPVLMFGITIVFHFVAMGVLDGTFEGVDPSCVALPLDVVVLLGSGYLVERLFKRLMPSRRQATLTGDALVVTDRRKQPPTEATIRWDQMINVLAWRFAVPRRSRVPKGWYCMAVQLLQDDAEIILYTFTSPKDAEAMANYAQFVLLRPRRETEASTDLRAAAEQRRLLKLEDARWNDGGEVAPEDFDAVLAAIAKHVPEWRSTG